MTEQALTAEEQRLWDRIDAAWRLVADGAPLTALNQAQKLLADVQCDAAFTAMTHVLIGQIYLALNEDPDRSGEQDLDHAVAHMREGRHVASPADHVMLGIALADRFVAAEPGSAEERAAMDDAIAELDEAVRSFWVDQDDPALIEAAVILGVLLGDRDEKRGLVSDREHAIEVLASALPRYERLDGHDPGVRLLACGAWGRALAIQINESGDRTELDTAITLLTEVTEADADGCEQWAARADRPEVFDRLLLADLLRQRSARDGNRRDAERGIALLRPIAEAMPADEPERGEVLHDLVLLYAVRCGGSSSTADVEASIAIAESALPAIPAPWHAQIAVLLAIQYLDRVCRRHGLDGIVAATHEETLGRDPDIRAARALLIEHLAQLPEEHDLYPTAVTAALFAVSMTLDGESGPQDADRAAEIAERARAAHPAGSEEHLAAVSILGIVLSDRAARDFSAQTLADAIAALEEAVAGTAPDAEIRNLLRLALGAARVKRSEAALDSSATQAGLDLVVEAYAGLTPRLRDSWAAADMLGRASFDATDENLPGVDTRRVVELLERHLDRDLPADPVRRGGWLTYTGSALASLALHRDSRADLDRAIGRLVEAVELLPVGQKHRYVALIKLASALAVRYVQAGDAADLEAARGRLDRARQELPADWNNRQLLLRLIDQQDDALDILLARFTPETADEPARRFPPPRPQDDPVWDHPAVGASFHARRRGAEAMRYLQHNAKAGDAESHRTAAAELVAAAEGLPDGVPDRAMYLAMASTLLLDPRLAFTDYGLFSDSIQALRKLLLGRISDTERFTALMHLSFLLWSRYGMNGREIDRAESLDRVRQAVEAAGSGRVAFNAGAQLWLAFLLSTDPATRAEAAQGGIEALTGFATEIFLQGDARDALGRSRFAAKQAVMVADWCVADGAYGQAVAALELGRGLLLHAATTAVDLGDLLDSVGQTDLAAEWRRDAGDVAAPSPETLAAAALEATYVPPALRKRVLDALAELPQGHARLLSAPTAGEIAAGLRSGGRDALVYLVAATEDMPGRALAVLTDGAVYPIDLPGLDVQPGTELGDFIEAHRDYRHRARFTNDDAAATASDGEAAERWRQALDTVGAWAWPAVVAPVLNLIQTRNPASGLPSVVLVPFGDLGAVPWHAAYTEPSTARQAARRRRYALDDAVFSYAASARQFLETAARPRPDPRLAPLFLSNTVHDLWWASLETAAIRSAHYPEAPYFGQIRGLPEVEVETRELLARLDGAAAGPVTMLHVACHGESGVSPLDSCLYLSGMARLETRAVLRQAFGRQTPAPGGLVVLGSCLSDASERDHDEALTVATAFVTAGATSVVGTQWEAPDRRSALLMFMFHHRLGAGSRPVEALREAQLWMLDPGREVPAEMPDYLATAARGAARSNSQPQSQPQPPSDRMDSLDGWAAFVLHGW